MTRINNVIQIAGKFFIPFSKQNLSIRLLFYANTKLSLVPAWGNFTFNCLIVNDAHPQMVKPFSSHIPRDEAAFEILFKMHYKGVLAYAFTLLQNKAEAEEIKQAVLAKLWEKKEQYCHYVLGKSLPVPRRT